ncbi:hypothetical protein [Streptomyces sp. RPT161]|uniref:hypothetical protein n=1 Tax=Streptomyces sp. RPT161 TaxID=3015993 RepID=UPI0022B8A8AC|nr:hypothetical protein [Streptomyces sp. RPT161]
MGVRYRFAGPWFRPRDLRDRLVGAGWYDDEEFAAYGLAEDQITELRPWAQEWVSNLGHRLNTHLDGEGF